MSGRGMLFVALASLATGAVAALFACPCRDGAPGTARAESAAATPAKVGRDVGHMHNVHEVTPRVIRGSQPEGEADFAEIAKLGAKVVVSVDGARPDVESARRHGLRYVHVPMGYDGLTRAEQVLLYKAFKTLDGPFYVHCHHGAHRGPAAAAIGLLGVEGWTSEQAVAELQRAGTAAKYEGLYALAREFTVPTAEELAAAPDTLPEVAPVPGLTDAMVLIDQSWEHLGVVKQAGWKADPAHPDIHPGHEATILAQRYREMARLDEIVKSKPDMLRHTQESERAAWDLSEALRAVPMDPTKVEAAYARIEQSCVACHKQFRDTPNAAGSR
jgi:protein tyrosine phosphatase (PTP) superfamily phosphohydrolase (DUF442 family)